MSRPRRRTGKKEPIEKVDMPKKDLNETVIREPGASSLDRDDFRERPSIAKSPSTLPSSTKTTSRGHRTASRGTISRTSDRVMRREREDDNPQTVPLQERGMFRDDIDIDIRFSDLVRSIESLKSSIEDMQIDIQSIQNELQEIGLDNRKQGRNLSSLTENQNRVLETMGFLHAMLIMHIISGNHGGGDGLLESVVGVRDWFDATSKYRNLFNLAKGIGEDIVNEL